MASIKGINIVIGSDTTGLQAALKDVNKHSREIASELKQVERLLKFNPQNTELLAQKQALLAEQVDNTRQKLETLKAAQEQVNEQFKKGEISVEQHRAFQRELVKTESQLKNYEQQLRQATLQADTFAAKTTEMGEKLSKVGQRMSEVGKTLSTRLTAPLAAMGAVAGKAAIDFESAFAGVRKTVDATEAQFARLEQGIRNMAKEIPASANEIAGVAEAAGQLGIATDHILSFTRTMIDLGESTNMSADDAATALARLANITQMPQSEFDRLGSTVVALGNRLATTEAEIVNMGLRLAGAGSQIGMTEAQILSFAGALSSVGIAAEAGGSAFSKVMIEMQLAAETGGQRLQDFARVAGMTGDQFRHAFQEDAAGALLAFINGLQRAEEQGETAIKVLDDIGITEVRTRDALLRAAGAGELFAEAIALGTRAWEENTALSEEAAQRYETTAAKIEIMRNRLNEVAITFGEILLPPLIEVTEKIGAFADWLANLNPALQRTIVVVAGLAAAIGPLVLLAGQLTSAFGTLVTAVGTLAAFVKTSLIPAMAGLAGPILATIAAAAGLAAVAYTVREAWDEIKASLVATWELLTGSAQQAGLKMTLAFEEMRHSVLRAVDAILERLSVLEDLPFGLGEKFVGLKDRVGEGVGGAAQRIEELRAALETNAARMGEAIENTKVAFGDLGVRVAEIWTGIVDGIRGQTAEASEQLEDQTDTIELELGKQVQTMWQGQQRMTEIVEDEGAARVEATQDSEEEQTEIISDEAEKRADERARFEEQWNRKLFQLTADRLAQLDAEMAEALAKAEELEADKTAIIEYYAIRRQQILDAEVEQEREREQRRLDTVAKFEDQWERKLFDATATRLEQLEREKAEALAQAEELGAEKTAIIQYYALQQQKILDEQAEAETRRHELQLAALTQFEEQWRNKLFQATADRLDVLEREKQEALRKAEELGADKTAIYEYYAVRRQEILDEELEKERERDRQRIEQLQAFQDAWDRKLFEQSATRLELLERDKQEALRQAEELGADTAAILRYYAEEERRLLEELQAQRDAARERELKAEQAAAAQLEKSRRAFEESWTLKLFEQSTDRIERLRWEREQALTEADKLGADKTAIVVYYAEEEKRILADLEAERERQRERERRAEEELQRERERLLQQWKDRLFGQTANELEILEAQKQKELQLAEELGIEKTAIIEYYANEQQKILERQRAAEEKAAREAAKREAEILQAREKARAELEATWARKLFELRADELELLERDKQEALRQAEEIGAETTAILEYYAEKELHIRQQRADEARRIAEAEADAERRRIEELERARLEFEQQWEGRLFDLTATQEDRLAREREQALARAAELGADVNAILEYYARRQIELAEEIAEEQHSLWEKAFDAVKSPLERFVEAVSNAAEGFAGVVKAIKAGNWQEAFLSVVMETESFAKAMELIGAVLGPVVTLFDTILRPVIEFLIGLWNGIIDALASISIFGWKPFKGLKKYRIDAPEAPEDSGPSGGTSGRGGGRQISEITGPTRDLLVDLLSPLANLNAIVAPIQDIRNILDARLPDFSVMGVMAPAAVGAGGSINVTIDRIVVQAADSSPNSVAGATVDTIERLIAERLAFARRGRGGR